MKRGTAETVWGLGLGAAVLALIGAREWRKSRAKEGKFPEIYAPPQVDAPPRGTYR